MRLFLHETATTIDHDLLFSYFIVSIFTIINIMVIKIIITFYYFLYFSTQLTNPAEKELRLVKDYFECS